MENGLIEIKDVEIAGEKINGVDARELWTFLESKQEFAAWIKNRIKQYDFTQRVDFTSFDKIIKAQNTYKTTIEYHTTIDMAKELAMVERNEKGKQARQYFIDCERKLRIVVSQTPQLSEEEKLAEAYLIAQRVMAKKDEQIEVMKQEKKVMKPFAIESMKRADGGGTTLI